MTAKATALTFYGAHKDIQKLEKVHAEPKPIAEPEIGKLLLSKRSLCREFDVPPPGTLLHYFGEEYTEDNCCGNCDSAQPQTEVDARASLKMALGPLRHRRQVQGRLPGQCPRGQTTALIKTTDTISQEMVRCGGRRARPASGGRAAPAKALILGLVDKNIENYGLISVNRKGEGYIAMPFALDR